MCVPVDKHHTTNTLCLGLDYNHRTNTTGVYRICGGNHKGWSRWVDKELGNYDYLLGMDVCPITLCLGVDLHL